MKDIMAALKVNLNLLLKRIYEMDFDQLVNIELEQMLNEVNQRIYELSDLIEQIEALQEF